MPFIANRMKINVATNQLPQEQGTVRYKDERGQYIEVQLSKNGQILFCTIPVLFLFWADNKKCLKMISCTKDT